MSEGGELGSGFSLSLLLRACSVRRLRQPRGAGQIPWTSGSWVVSRSTSTSASSHWRAPQGLTRETPAPQPSPGGSSPYKVPRAMHLWVPEAFAICEALFKKKDADQIAGASPGVGRGPRQPGGLKLRFIRTMERPPLPTLAFSVSLLTPTGTPPTQLTSVLRGHLPYSVRHPYSRFCEISRHVNAT